MSLTASDALARLELLDEPDEWGFFSQPLEGAAQARAGRWESTVALEGVRCAGCARNVERLLGAVPGVVAVEVNAAAKRGRVVWDAARTRPSRWMRALQGSGYSALPAHNLQASAARQESSRRMLWRVGVACICMMQVMMYAAPSYFSTPERIGPELLDLLRWAQWVLSLPVLVFSCRPFFEAAWRDVRLLQVSMDLPVALGMLITFVVSTLGTFQPAGPFGEHVYFDSFTMFVFFLLTGRWLELRLRDRSAGALEALMHRLPESVERRDKGGNWRRVAVRRIRPGDVVRVLPGEAFPGDGRLQRGATTVDEALLTGESTPLARQVGDAVIAGSHNLTATVEMRVEQVGDETRYAQIVALMEQALVHKPRLARIADRLARPFLLFVILAAGLTCLWWWQHDPGRALMIAVSVLVVTCPCALSLATPAAMLASAGALARRGVLVRRLQAIEALSQVDTVVFDKTGTLTKDAFVLERVRTREGVSRQQALALAAGLAQHSRHPVSRALVAAAAAEGVEPAPGITDAEEVAGAGVQGKLQGETPDAELRLGSAAFCSVARTPGADGPVSHLSDERGWLATFALHEELRADAAEAVAALRAQGLAVRLMSGDQPQAALRVGALLGMDEARGGCAPADKLQLLRQAQQQGHRTVMVGDGLNDGPVLAGAHASFAFGRAVPLAQAQSDFVVLSPRLMAVAEARQQAQRTLRVVRQNLAWALAYNLCMVPLAMAGWVPPWLAGLGMAASSLTVVANAMRLNADPGDSADDSSRLVLREA